MDFILEALSREAPAEQKNALLTKTVKARHIKFVMEEEEEKQLRDAGASEGLIAAIRKESAIWHNTPFYYVYRGNKFQTLGKKFMGLGNEEEAQKNFEKAISSYQQLLTLDAENKTDFTKTAYNNLGVIYESLKRYDDSIASFTKAIELEQAVVRYMNRAIIYEKRGLSKKDLAERKADFDKAVEDYTKAIEIDPNYIPAYKQRAENHKFWGRKELQKADEQMIINLRNGTTQPVASDSKP
jgi:tetratricopeptide (TPR) repeat protein